jgi:hypothetical protein
MMWIYETYYGIKRERLKIDYLSRVEAGSNTSTVALGVIGGDEKGSLEFETVKCGRESHGIQTRE